MGRFSREWTPAVIPAGLLIALLGAWAALVPLVGPYFDFGFHTDETWAFTEAHWTLSLAPGIAAGVAGLLMTFPSRAFGATVAILATLAGAWLVLGPTLYPLWNPGETVEPIAASENLTALKWVGYYYGPGALILFLSGLAEGMLSRGTREREVVRHERDFEHEATIVEEPGARRTVVR